MKELAEQIPHAVGACVGAYLVVHNQYAAAAVVYLMALLIHFADKGQKLRNTASNGLQKSNPNLN